MGQTLAKDIRGPVEQLLELVVPGVRGHRPPASRDPVRRCGPGVLRVSHVRARAFGPRRSCVTGTTSTASRPSCSESASPGWMSCPRRCSAPLSPSAPGPAWRRRRCGRAAACCGCSCAMPTAKGLVRGDLWKTVEWPQAYRLSDHPPLDLLGRRRQGARRGRSPHAVREAGLRDLAAAGDLRPSRPRGRGADPGRHRLEARAAGHPRAQGRALDRLPAVGRGRRGARRLPPARPAGQPRPARLLPGDGAGAADRRPTPSPAAPGATCCAQGSRSLARARTRCGTFRRPAAGGRRLLAEDDRGLRRAPLGGLDGDLRQGGRRVAPRGRPRRR